MYRVQNIGSDPNQKQTLVLPDGTFIELTIQFVPMQLGWFITELKYGDFELHGVRIVNSPDMLYQFRNQIPFGIACYSNGDREPSLIDDFASDASRLFILTEDDVQAYTDYLTGVTT